LFPDYPWALAPVQHWHQGASNGEELVAPISSPQLAGEYVFYLPNIGSSLGGLPGAFFGRMSIAANGSVCIQAYPACSFVGQIDTPEGETGVIGFEIRSTLVDGKPMAVYRGRGWLSQTADGATLSLIGVGDHGRFGLALTGRRH
jgi:hypothetical protein